MAATLLSHLSRVETVTGLPASYTAQVEPERFAGRHRARLAKSVGLTQFGVNHVTLEPGSMSSLRHWHQAEDEFVYVLSGTLTLVDDNGEHVMEAGSFAGFPAGTGNAHHLLNTSADTASFLVVGSRRPGEDVVYYPDDDLGPKPR